MKSVLVVEDDPDTMESLVTVLRGEGWLPHQATNVHQATVTLHSHSLDAVVADNWLPDGKGSQFLRLAAALQPSARRILYTGQEADPAGTYRIIRKPAIDKLLANLRGD
ncbi:MAG: hypothetical protein QOD77_1332 [Thermoplasmata archaeon]|nr:hypothetical protein [Thermoplasmata archaeon]